MNELTKSGLQDLLLKMQPQMKMALPRHVSAEMIHRVVLTEVSKNPAILRCTQESVLRAVMEACQLGLVPNSTQGLAYLVPYKTTCQLIPGYKGLIKLALQSGKVSKIWAKVVHEEDSLEYEEGVIPKLVHKPFLDGDPGEFVGAYAVAKMINDPDPQFEYMGKTAIDLVRRKSASGGKGPWADSYEEMAKKTVIKNLCKRLPLDSDRVHLAAEKAEGGMSGMAYDLEVKDFVYVAGDEDIQDNAAGRLNAELAEKGKPNKRKKQGPTPLMQVEANGKTVSNLSGKELALEQLKAQAPEDLQGFYSRSEVHWLNDLGPEAMTEIDEVYITLREDAERPPEAA